MEESTFFRYVFLILAALLTLFPASAGEDETERELTIDDIPTRIAEAEVGEWALYRLGDGKRSRLTVAEKWDEGKDTHLVVMVETMNAKGKRLRIEEERVVVSEAVADLRRLGPEDRLSEREVLVHGRALDAIVIDYVEDGELVRQSYLSDEIPVYGLVRGVNPKAKVKTALSLIDYGFADDD